MPETLSLTPSETVTVIESTPERLLVEGRYGPGGDPPPPHHHPDQDERFEVLEGSLETKVGAERRTLKAGDTVEIPRGTPHQMWNPHSEPARVEWRTEPALRTEQWFRSIDALHRSGRVGDDGMPSTLAFATLITEFSDVFRLSAKPEPVVRAALAGLAVIGRVRGYGPAER
jgi:mannose-6-phosphate isomerase-like protein (cupin superfamily)